MNVEVDPQQIIKAQTKQLGRQATEIAIRDAAIEQLQRQNARLRAEVERVTRAETPEGADEEPAEGAKMPA